MKLLLPTTFALLALFSFNSCSSGLGNAELAAITSVSVPKATLGPTSYKYPSAFELDDNGRTTREGVGSMGALVGMATADNDLAGYLVGGILGSAVGQGIADNQKANFMQNYGRYFSQLRGKVPSDLTTMVTNGVKSQVKANSFLGPRLSDKGSHQFSVRVKRHQLCRYGSDPRSKQPLMCTYVELEIALYGPGQRVLFSGTYLGKSRIAMDIPTLASSKQISRDAYREAVNNACQKFARDLRTKVRS